MLGTFLTAALAAPTNHLGGVRNAKEMLVNKFLEVAQPDTKILDVLVHQSSRAASNKRQMQSAFESIALMCATQSDSIVPLLVSSGYTNEESEVLMTCICSDGFDVATADAMFGGSGADDLEPLCSNECTPMVELLFGVLRRRLEETTPVPDVVDVIERRLQASPEYSPAYSPDFSPSPSPDSIDPVEYFYCACEVPSLQDGDMLDESVQTAICRSSACAPLLEGMGMDCPLEEDDYEYSVSMSMTAAGTVEDYTPEVVGELTTEFAELFGVPESQCEVTITSGSVNIEVTIFTEDEDAADEVFAVMETTDEATLTTALADVTLASGATIEVESIDEIEKEEIDNSQSLKDKLLEACGGGCIAGIAGGVIGGLVGIIIGCCFCRKSKKVMDE